MIITIDIVIIYDLLSMSMRGGGSLGYQPLFERRKEINYWSWTGWCKKCKGVAI